MASRAFNSLPNTLTTSRVVAKPFGPPSQLRKWNSDFVVEHDGTRSVYVEKQVDCIQELSPPQKGRANSNNVSEEQSPSCRSATSARGRDLQPNGRHLHFFDSESSCSGGASKTAKKEQSSRDPGMLVFVGTPHSFTRLMQERRRIIRARRSSEVIGLDAAQAGGDISWVSWEGPPEPQRRPFVIRAAYRCHQGLSACGIRIRSLFYQRLLPACFSR